MEEKLMGGNKMPGETELDLLTLSKTVHTDALTSWTDDKRKEFVRTFEGRVRVSQYILFGTALILLEEACKKSYMPFRETEWRYRMQQQKNDLVTQDSQSSRDSQGNAYFTSIALQVGGRPIAELNAIAGERAQSILDSLPPLKKAVEIISPETAALMAERDKVLEDGKEALRQAEELSGAISMDDFPETMTLAEFRAIVKDRRRRRSDLLEKLTELGDKGSVLQKKIDKFLYSGIPGLADAIRSAIQEHLDKATGLSAMARRVSEQVKFGESAAALEILGSFEKDELSISETVKAQFDKALEGLKLLAASKKTTKKVKS